MKKLNFLPVIFTLFFLSAANSQTAPPEDDFQFWNDTQVSFPLIKSKDSKGKKFDRFSFFLLGTFRAGDNISRPIDERIGFGFDYTINKYATFSPSYIYRAGQPVGGRKEFEHRVRFDLNLEKKWNTFSIRDRNRVEYRIRHSRSNSVRYRNRIQLRIPVKKDDKELFTPFVSTEPFYDFTSKTWFRNEISAGINRKLTGNTSADFFYLWQRNRGNILKNVNVIGVNLKFKVD